MKNHIDQSHLEALKKVADQRNIETETPVPPLAFTETERVSNKVVRYRRLSQAETESETENKQGVRNEHRWEWYDFHKLAFRLLSIDYLPLPRLDGKDGDPYLTDGNYQRLCNIVCERLPGMTVKEWRDSSKEKKTLLLKQISTKTSK